MVVVPAVQVRECGGSAISIQVRECGGSASSTKVMLAACIK